MLRDWCGRTCACFILSAAMLIAVWVGTHAVAVDWRSPAYAGAPRAMIQIHRGLIALTLVQDSPARLPMELRVHRRDAIRAACWDQLYWNDSFAGLSAGDGVIWMTRPEGESVARQWQGIVLPIWLLTTLLLAWPVRSAIAAFRTKRRLDRGECRVCGYDLAGLAGACPACEARTHVIGAGRRLQLVSPA